MVLGGVDFEAQENVITWVHGKLLKIEAQRLQKCDGMCGGDRAGTQDSTRRLRHTEWDISEHRLGRVQDRM